MSREKSIEELLRQIDELEKENALFRDLFLTCGTCADMIHGACAVKNGCCNMQERRKEAFSILGDGSL